jgi:hypothetical protein
MSLRSDKDVETYLLKSRSDDNEKMSCYRQFNRGFNFYEENYIFPLPVCKENRAVFPFCRKFWWQSSKTFQKVNYVTCSLVIWKYRFGAYLILFITLERSKTRQDKFESILEIIEFVVSSPFVKAEADSVKYFVLCLKRNRAVFPFCRKIWWQSSKTFQKVNYVTCSLVLWKYRFGVICTKMLQIQRNK